MATKQFATSTANTSLLEVQKCIVATQTPQSLKQHWSPKERFAGRLLAGASRGRDESGANSSIPSVGGGWSC